MKFNSIIIIIILSLIITCNIFLCFISNNTIETIESKDENDKIDYESNNYDVEYHDNEKDLEKEQGFGLDPQEIVVFDPKKKEMVSLYVPKNQTSPLYNEPGHFKYSAENYVPSYTEANLLKTNEMRIYNKLFR
tara:strand:+ start:764 stop:1165 length:402 start_codon:yes stop_codon:yes gene_type:complete